MWKIENHQMLSQYGKKEAFSGNWDELQNVWLDRAYSGEEPLKISNKFWCFLHFISSSENTDTAYEGSLTRKR